MSDLALAIAVKGEWDPHRLLRALRQAGANSSSEVHVACDPEFAPPTIPGLSIHSRAKASLFELWGLAIAHCEAPWVAVLHADTLPAPGWYAAMRSAIARNESAEGYFGPVEPRFGTADPRMVGYLTEYVQFHRPLDPGLREVPGNNIMVLRARLGASAALQSVGFAKTELLRQSFAPLLVEDAVVEYSRPLQLFDYCRRRFHHGRAFAAARTPRLSLLVAVPMTAALPLVRTARILRHAWRHEALRMASLRWLPAILMAETCWSAGELTGYVSRRAGDSSALD